MSAMGFIIWDTECDMHQKKGGSIIGIAILRQRVHGIADMRSDLHIHVAQAL